MTGAGSLAWPLILMALGLGLLILETMVPSGGMIGILSLGCLALSLYHAFSTSLNTGLWFSLALGVLAPVALGIGLYLWPKTPVGKRLTLRPPDSDEVFDERAATHRLDHLLGSFGRALTPLRPSGMADFEGRRIDVMAEEGLVPAGSLVKATAIRNGRLVVRAADASALDRLMQE